MVQEIKTDEREDLFAATPPLEAKKILFSITAHRVGVGRKTTNIDFVDVRRAHFQARARRTVYVKLPEEDMEEGMCG